jgi:hypothetical protein
MDECQGSTLNDSSGGSHPATFSVGASGTYTSVGTCGVSSASSSWYNGAGGKRNYSLAFDGTDTSASGTALTGIGNSWTMSGWIKKNGHNDLFNGGAVFSQGVESNGVNIKMIIDDFGSVTCGTYPNFNGYGSNLADGNWHHVTCVNDSNAGTVKVYEDGVQIGSNNQGATNSSSGTFYIGTKDGTNEVFKGQLDDIRVYNYALTAAQVKTLYTGGAINFAPITGTP